MKLLLAAVALSAALAGCATRPPPPLQRATESGQAEALFRGRTADALRETLLTACLRLGAEAQAGANEVLCTKPMPAGGRAVLAQLAIGNSYSTHPEERVRFSLLPRPDGVRVIAYPWVETTLPGGQVRKLPLDDNGTKNALQGLLLSLGGD